MIVKVGTKLKCKEVGYLNVKKNKVYEVLNIYYKDGCTLFDIKCKGNSYELIDSFELNQFEVME